MNKIDFLKVAVENEAYKDLSWLYQVLTIPITATPENLKTYGVSKETNGFFFKDEEGKMVRLDGVEGETVFHQEEPVTIDSTWMFQYKKESVSPRPFVKEKTETTVGRLIANAIIVFMPFRSNLSFINKKFTISTVEDIVAPLIKSNPDNIEDYKENEIYVKDLLKLNTQGQYLAQLSSALVSSGSMKLITKPEGIEDFIKELVKKYEGKLSDPVSLVEFENELRKFDDDYLKDDPGYGKFISGKVKNIARKKMFLIIGAELSFDDKSRVEPILTSLADGWSDDPEEFSIMMDSIRYASYSSGVETQKGGVVFKTLVRATNTIGITDKDCGTTLGLTRTYRENDYKKLVGRYILQKGKPFLVESPENAKAFIDKEVTLRSPMYCKEDSGNFCHICVGKRISSQKDGLTNLLAEISSTILTTALKAKHGSKTENAEISLQNNFS